MDEDRQRDGRVVHARARRAVGLLRARDAFDDGVDGLEVARVRGEQDRRLAGARAAAADRAQVVLDVPARALGGAGDRLDRPLALELAQDLLVRPPMMCARTFRRPRWAIPITTSCAPCSAAELDRLVEHRHHHVEPFDRELLLPEERALR